ncbi:MAG: DNA polymerase I, partial [Legionellales bacterium]
MLRRLRREYAPKHVLIIFDAKGGDNFRKKIYTQYKANRTAIPDDLASQIAPLYEAIEHLGFKIFIQPGVEADDVIGSMTKQLVAAGQSVLIATGDKDITQLIKDNVKIVDTMKNVIMDSHYVKLKFGVMPNQIIDYLTLVGDTSDNIPGVPKVGPKTAANWLEKYETLENIVKHADDIKGKVGENLRNTLDWLDTGKDLVTIRCDLQVPLVLDDLIINNVNIEKLRPLLERYEVKSWLKEFATANVQTTNTPDVEKVSSNTSTSSTQTITCITTETELQNCIKLLNTANNIIIDVFTDITELNTTSLVSIVLGTTQDLFYLPLQHNYIGVPQQLDIDQTLEKLKDTFENKNITKTGYDLKRTIKVLLQYDIQLPGELFDIMLACFVLEGGANKYKFTDISARHLDIDDDNKIPEYTDITGKGAKQIAFDNVTVETATDYAKA